MRNGFPYDASGFTYLAQMFQKLLRAQVNVIQQQPAPGPLKGAASQVIIHSASMASPLLAMKAWAQPFFQGQRSMHCVPALEEVPLGKVFAAWGHARASSECSARGPEVATRSSKREALMSW